MANTDYKVTGGVYATMVTPYKNGEIDYETAERLVDWYWREGCDGIFAACASSEIAFLSLDERVKLTRTVVRRARELAEKDKSRAPLAIVASGHVSCSFYEQVKELQAIAAEGPDALILISNRMDIGNTTDEKWIEETQRLVDSLPSDIPLGIYESPIPYKRLLTEKMIKWCADSGRFYFIKDTSCDAAIIKKRVELCEGSNLKIFNANAQTLLESVKDGAFGYCGVMANVHPSVYSRLLKANDLNSEMCDKIQAYITLSTIMETLTYPCSAKYYLDKYEGIKMSTYSRSANEQNLTAYQKSCIDQFALVEAIAKKELGI